MILVRTRTNEDVASFARTICAPEVGPISGLFLRLPVFIALHRIANFSHQFFEDVLKEDDPGDTAIIFHTG